VHLTQMPGLGETGERRQIWTWLDLKRMLDIVLHFLSLRAPTNLYRKQSLDRGPIALGTDKTPTESLDLGPKLR